MPFTGDVDVSELLEKLGTKDHGLVPYGTREQAEREEIYRAAWGETDMSTSVGLRVVPKFVWDVNRYYRDLGIDWPFKPTKKELRLAYQACDGSDDERLTYCFKQLLQPDIRAEYDAMPLGSRYDDKYVREENNRKLSDIAKEESKEQGKLVTIKDLTDSVDEELPPLPPARTTWDWGYYALKSRKFDPETLALWQQLLIDAFANQGLEVVVSIGYIGRVKQSVVLKNYDGKAVFFLREDTHPTTEHAEAAVAMYKAQERKR